MYKNNLINRLQIFIYYIMIVENKKRRSYEK